MQRVKHASVEIDSKTIGEIEQGMLILLGIHQDDTEEESRWLSRKCAHLRIFADQEGRMNHSLQKIQGDMLVVPQFTLYGNVNNGHRPSFDEPAPPKRARNLFQHFVEQLENILQKPVPTGEFGAMMQVHLQNDGPVTFWVERKSTD